MPEKFFPLLMTDRADYSIGFDGVRIKIYRNYAKIAVLSEEDTAAFVKAVRDSVIVQALPPAP